MAGDWRHGFIALIVAGALAGCTSPLTPTEPELTLDVAFATNWSQAKPHYFMTSNEALPEGFRVSVLEKETGVKQDLSASQLSARSSGRYDVAASVTLKAGHVYRIEAFVGDESVGFRELTATEHSLDDVQVKARATYTARMKMRDSSQDSGSDLWLRGTYVADFDGAKHTGHFVGKGGANATYEGFQERLTLSTYEFEDVDNITTKMLIDGYGPWTMSGDYSASGTMTARSELVGRESKQDEAGQARDCYKTFTRMTIQGTVFADGDSGQMDVVSEEYEWDRVDTEETIWRKSVETTTVTVAGQPESTTESSDEAVTGEDADPDILDVMDFQGLAPFPIMDGDNFGMRGLEGLRIQYYVTPGGTRMAGGQSFDTVKVIGTVSSGGSGTETWHVVAAGPLRGLTVSGAADYERAAEAASMTLDLSAVS